MKKICFIAVLFLAVNVFGDLVPGEAYLKVVGRTPVSEETIKDDAEIRLGLAKLDIYSVYFLYEREDFLLEDKEWYIGYGGIVDILRQTKIKLQFETFDRHRYKSNSQSIRAFLSDSIYSVDIDYGVSMLGTYFKDFQPAGFLGINYKSLSCKWELDVEGRLVSSERFAPKIEMSNTSGLQLEFEHRNVNRHFYKVSAMIYYKEK